MLDRAPHAHTPIERRRAERELFFWTAFQALKLIATAALVVYLVIALLEGELPGAPSVARTVGAG